MKVHVVMYKGFYVTHGTEFSSVSRPDEMKNRKSGQVSRGPRIVARDKFFFKSQEDPHEGAQGK